MCSPGTEGPRKGAVGLEGRGSAGFEGWDSALPGKEEPTGCPDEWGVDRRTPAVWSCCRL